MSLIVIDDFDLPDRVKSMFVENGWIDGRDLIYNLELYDFVHREELIRVMNSKGFNVKSIDVYSPVPVYVTLYEKIKEIEKENPVISEIRGKDSVLFISDVFNQQQVERLAVQVTVSDVSLDSVTPRNFELLKDPSISPDWDYRVLLRRIVLDCIDKKGRDIHIGVKTMEYGLKYYVKFRIADMLEEFDLFQIDRSINKELIFGLVSSDTNAFSQDLDTKHGVEASVIDLFGDKKVSLRVSAMKVNGGYKCVCRVQQFTTTSLKINELGFSKDIQDDLLFVSQKKGGLTMITGAMNTGKNTTAFGMINDMIKRPELAIADYSSPVEVSMPVDQVDYKGDPVYLRNLVRLSRKQDLDVLHINELADEQVALAAMGLVYSSVHVITTTHINRIWHLPHKMKEFFGDGFKSIFTQMNACFNQRMFKKQCPHCKVHAAVSELGNPHFKKILQDHGVDFYYLRQGCSECEGPDRKVFIQPYMERFVMDEELLAALMRVDLPYEMEEVIREYVKSKKYNLEYTLSKAVERGDIEVHSLMSIL